MNRLQASCLDLWDRLQASCLDLWDRLQASCPWRRPVIHIDFETRSRGEGGEFICGAYKIGDGPVITFTRSEDASDFPLDYRGKL